MLRNEKDRLAYASMEPTQKSELVVRRRNRNRDKRMKKSLCSSGLEDTEDVGAGMHCLMLGHVCFESRFAALQLLDVHRYKKQMKQLQLYHVL